MTSTTNEFSATTDKSTDASTGIKAPTPDGVGQGAAPEAESGGTLTRERVLAVCRSNWEYRGVDDASVREMLAELTAHLEEAAAAGRTPQDVVGPDVKAFAAAWARARTPLLQRALRMAALAPLALGALLLLTHLLDRSLVLPVEAPRVAFYVVLAAAAVAWETRRGNLGFRGWVIAGMSSLVISQLISWGIGDDPLFHLPLWGTLLFLLPGLPYAVHDIRAKRAETPTG
ncbi:hypothetical protein [Streptomyces sp. G45]|uniref:hypothetical protein n=1 Tax=Streptomyces sp. G45 TaxID=3406627 RepID=UPI003C224BB7